MIPPRRLQRLVQVAASPQCYKAYLPCRQYSSNALDFETLRTSMLSRPEKLTYDILSPTPTHLLNISLSDFLPPSCHPPIFNPSSALSSGLSPSKATPPQPLPEAHHLVYFPPQLPASGLTPDGTDPFHSPGAPFDRRMWASGSISFNKPLLVNRQQVVCRESLGDVTVKGRPGEEKIFVDVWRRYGEDDGFVAGEEAITERRSLVFLRRRSAEEAREVAREGVRDGRVVKAPHKPTFNHTLLPTSTLLFHYSALTFNAHQIHLNPTYCREVEGHRNLLFHGPLSLTFMVSVLRSQLGKDERVKKIDYRNLAPLYAEEPLTVCVRQNGNGEDMADGHKKWDVWVEDSRGGLCVKGSAVSNSA
ncbi:uncharacterized protein BCR38DRAFT_460541 [Pseudomassariella vexata]|uniref:HotDog domain-containing protein n=1 Tax=Pseudomassariella vexata TaxID=1141098 RepID=A0A1Y2DKF2_9PEZI|nr:uncharacterized protein BCR38DRAFT_460541 [Pseudomassariella vexata]ORY59235.1 hypothetical protein BCR38DRAFT_460541 [Pseudomassariella vexata]